jgi:chromate reductase
MKKIEIAVVIGSLRKDSINRKLAKIIEKLAPSEFSFKHVEIGNLPLYNQDDDANQASEVKRLKTEISSAQGLLFVSPEYNRSIPGVLKKCSRPRLKTLWTKCLGQETCRGFRNIAWRSRHSLSAAAFA